MKAIFAILASGLLCFAVTDTAEADRYSWRPSWSRDYNSGIYDSGYGNNYRVPSYNYYNPYGGGYNYNYNYSPYSSYYGPRNTPYSTFYGPRNYQYQYQYQTFPYPSYQYQYHYNY
ncbi:hypothetical protein [Rubinisphaera margarita]|uniref:hypothetical protein n=1 Tax=Rubinisphaera margarita TaxID=2909586 RepID=UPI001EE847EC|nr:hypothetical protein [Rubinisphaera margarita]MCG6156736.1 hypothetical protein [Rubinisphaera margarita]